jgi:hypothetical protein
VILKDNGGDALTRSADGSFTFATKVASGATYNVTVGTHPAGMYCSVTNGSATVGSAPVTDVTVTCAIGRPYATGMLATGNKKVLFLFAAAGTSLPDEASYTAYCNAYGFPDNKVKQDVGFGQSVDPTNYYCDSYCCFLGDGNSEWSQLTQFQNFGLPEGTPLNVFDRGCGSWCGGYNASLNTTDTINISGATSASYSPNGSNYCNAKSTTFDVDGVVVCQEP